MTPAEWAELEPKLQGMDGVHSLKTEAIKPDARRSI
jgi:hypothetical protein